MVLVEITPSAISSFNAFFISSQILSSLLTTFFSAFPIFFICSSVFTSRILSSLLTSAIAPSTSIVSLSDPLYFLASFFLLLLVDISLFLHVLLLTYEFMLAIIAYTDANFSYMSYRNSNLFVCFIETSLGLTNHLFRMQY